jgi:NAD(P)-dependent dehydrogenase (short-subunit alcohol dehydrogenase family)
MVNNAGTALYSALESTTEADFDQVFAVHVKGPFFLTQTPRPLIADGGRIVNISSALTRVSFPGSGPYASAKAAIEVLTRYQALEFASHGITANVIAPGAVPTDSARATCAPTRPCRTSSCREPHWTASPHRKVSAS